VSTRTKSGLIVPDDQLETTKAGVVLPRRKAKKEPPKGKSLIDLIRGVLLWRQGAQSPFAAVTRREVFRSTRRAREDNRERQLRRAARRARKINGLSPAQAYRLRAAAARRS
jgi:hypothetical protein